MTSLENHCTNLNETECNVLWVPCGIYETLTTSGESYSLKGNSTFMEKNNIEYTIATQAILFFKATTCFNMQHCNFL